MWNIDFKSFFAVLNYQQELLAFRAKQNSSVPQNKFEFLDMW